MITESEILNANILIVDDQESNISLLEQLLSDYRLHIGDLNHEPAGSLCTAS